MRGFAFSSPLHARSCNSMPKRSEVHQATAADLDTPAEQCTTSAISSARACRLSTNMRIARACERAGAWLSSIPQYSQFCSTDGSSAQVPGAMPICSSDTSSVLSRSKSKNPSKLGRSRIVDESWMEMTATALLGCNDFIASRDMNSTDFSIAKFEGMYFWPLESRELRLSGSGNCRQW